MQHEVRVEPLAAGRLQVRSVAPVDRYRDAERLRLVEDRIEVAAGEVDAAVVGRQHHADVPEFADRALEFCDRGRHVLHGERGRALEAIWRAGAEAGVVVVARPRHRDREVDVVDRRDRQSEAAVQHLDVDAVGVHVVEPRNRVARTLLHAAELRALDLLDVVLAQARLWVELAVHQDPGQPLGVGDQAWAQLAMGVVEEIGEDVDRLVDVRVGIDDRQVGHGDPLFVPQSSSLARRSRTRD